MKLFSKMFFNQYTNFKPRLMKIDIFSIFQLVRFMKANSILLLCNSVVKHSSMRWLTRPKPGELTFRIFRVRVRNEVNLSNPRFPKKRSNKHCARLYSLLKLLNEKDSHLKDPWQNKKLRNLHSQFLVRVEIKAATLTNWLEMALFRLF